jgi:hypothetical protein
MTTAGTDEELLLLLRVATALAAYRGYAAPAHQNAPRRVQTSSALEQGVVTTPQAKSTAECIGVVAGTTTRRQCVQLFDIATP